LPELDENLQLQNARLQSGTAQVILQYNGPLITNPALLQTINAKMLLKDGTILYEPRNLTFNNCNGEIIIAENSFAINHLTCDVKKITLK